MKKFIIQIIQLLILNIVLLFNTNAQSSCTEFYADTLRGCSPLRVTIKRCPNSTPIKSVVFYKFQNNFVLDSTFSYTTSGNHAVEIFWESTSFILPLKLDIYEPKEPEFSVKACAGKKIRLIIEDNYYEKFIVKLPNGKKDTLSRNESKSYQMLSEGIFPIEVTGKFYLDTLKKNLGFSGGNCGSKIINAQVYSQLPLPVFDSLVAFRGDSLQLNFKLSPGVQYYLEERKNNNTYKIIQAIKDTENRITLYNRSIRDTTYCYRIVTKDFCNNSSTYSQDICTVNLLVEAKNGLNVQNWSAYKGTKFTSYKIFKNNKLLKNLTNSNNITNNDNSIICNKNYCYYLKISVNNDKSFFIGYDTCVKSFNIQTPIKVAKPLVSINNETIEINFQTTQVYDSLFLLKSEQNKPFQKIYLSNKFYKDNLVNIKDSTYRYLIYYKDSCGNHSALSDTLSPMKLSVEKTSNDNILHWTSYKTFNNSFVYQIDFMDENNNPYRSTSEFPQNINTYTDLFSSFDKEVMRYRVKAINKTTNQISYSNILAVEKDFQIFVPNAFSPNDDGLNDTFEIKIFSLKKFKISIFDKWSNLVFESTDLNNQWDGSYQASPAPTGSYAYLIEAEDVSGKKAVKRGLIMLVR